MSNGEGETEKPTGLVPHPRFGDRPIVSGFSVSRAEILDALWAIDRDPFYEESVIPADVGQQTGSVLPRRYYVDRLKRCRRCRRLFLFFAVEQKHWYEALKFDLMADCLDCPECRKVKHQRSACHGRYSRNIHRPDLTDEEFVQLLDDAVVLFEDGEVREPKLRWLKNQALRRLPNHPVMLRILRALEEGGPGA